VINALFKHLAGKLSFEDYHQLAQILQLISSAPKELTERVIGLATRAEKIKGTETVVSKF